MGAEVERGEEDTRSRTDDDNLMVTTLTRTRDEIFLIPGYFAHIIVRTLRAY